MQQDSGVVQVFTPEMMEKIARVWMRSSLSVVDVRHQVIYPHTPMQHYRMPSSMLVFTSGGQADVCLDDDAFGVARFGIFHGGKGTLLGIAPVVSKLDAYLLYYKAESPLFFRKELQRLLEQINPFVQRFGYAPSNPIWCADLVRQMLTNWNVGAAMKQWQAKSQFYQLMLEVYRDLEQHEVKFLQPDPALAAKRYLDAHYREPIIFQEIADLFAISGGQLTRLFRKREGTTLQEYLTRKRLKVASEHLMHTHATVREIANLCGFVDENTLLRLFKKYYRLSPGEYRKKWESVMPGYVVDNNSQRLYNEEGLPSAVNTQRDGAFTMFGQRKSKEMMMAAAMSLMLLLTACSTNSGGVGNGSSPNATPAPSQAEQSSASQAVESQTRIIQTSNGDVEVPADPQRVVVQYLMGDVVALGVMPIGVSDVYEGAAFADSVADATSLGWFPEWEVESVMALEPDLILVINEDYIDKYDKIAPTVNIPYGDMTQEERITFMGEVLNRQEEAADLIQSFNDNLEQRKSELVQAGFDVQSVSIFEVSNESGVLVYGGKHGVGSIAYHSLGLKAPDSVQADIIDKDSYNETVSLEVLPAYSGDFIIRNVYDEMPDLSDNAIWNALPAVQNNRIVDMEFGFTYYSDFYSSTAQINFVAQSLLALAK